MARGRFPTFCMVAALACAGPGPSGADDLPEPVRRTLTGRFPGMVVAEVGTETEGGVRYYEVHLRDSGGLVEVEIAADGSVGETEAVVDLHSLPAAQQEQIRQEGGGGVIRRIEKHMRIGVPRDATFAPVAEPGGFYEVNFRDGGVNRSLQLPMDPAQGWVLHHADDEVGEDPATEDTTPPW